MERAHFAFRPSGRGFTAGHDTHAVRAEAGAFSVAPLDPRSGRLAEAAALRLETRAIRAGGAALDLTPARQSVSPETGALLIERAGGVTEVIRNLAAGVEQSWRLVERPAHSGDLVFEVAATGPAYTRETAGGLHFAAASGPGMRYSHATWIAADGARTPIRAALVGDRIRMTVPGELVAESAFPAVLDPVVGPEVAVDDPVVGPPGARSFEPEVAFTGSQYLAVWRDTRFGNSSAIVGTRLSDAGVILDPLGITIEEAATDVLSEPTVAFAGTVYLVAWEDRTGSNRDIEAASVSTTGAVTSLASPAATIAVEISPALAARGNQALLVYTGGGSVRASLFSGGGFAAGVTVSTGTDPVVAADPAGDYLVAWTEGGASPDLRGRFVDNGGAVSGGAFDISAANGEQAEPALSFDGSNFVAVWRNNNDIFGARITPGGLVLDTRVQGGDVVGGVAVSTEDGLDEHPTVACGPSGCLAAWVDGRDAAALGPDIYGVVIESGFNVGSSFPVAALDRRQDEPSAVAAGSQWFVVWRDNSIGLQYPYGARIESDGSLLDPDGILLATGNNAQVDATAARADEGWILLWSDSRAVGNDILAITLDGTGVKLDDPPFGISAAPRHQSLPDVTFDGSRYVAAWTDSRGANRDVFADRIEVDGQPLDGNGFAVTTGVRDQTLPAVAWSDGSSGLVVWQDRRAGNFDILGALIDSDGSVMSADIPVCDAAGDQVRASVAFDPERSIYLVAWSDRRAGEADIFAARVDTSGNVLDVDGLPVSSAAGNQLVPDVAYAGDEFLVAWEDRGADVVGDIVGARVTVDGSLQVLDADGIELAGGATNQGRPSVTASAGAFALAWSDGDLASETGLDIVARRVQLDGALAEPFTVSGESGDEREPVLAGRSEFTSLLAAYSRSDEAIGAPRVFARFVDEEGAGDAGPGGDGDGGPGQDGGFGALADDGGCGCRSSGPAGSGATVVLVLLALAAIRRRKRYQE